MYKVRLEFRNRCSILCEFFSQEIFVALCLVAVVAVQAHPAEDLETQQAVESLAVDPNVDVADLEGSESRGYGWGRGYGGMKIFFITVGATLQLKSNPRSICYS